MSTAETQNLEIVLLQWTSTATDGFDDDGVSVQNGGDYEAR